MTADSGHLTPDERAEIAAHDNKGFSEERCLRCGWVMGRPPINCNNDDTPHRFPSHTPISPAMTADSGHLPECNQRPFADGSQSKAPDCICDRLRACEARVRSFYDAEIEKQGAQWEASCRQFYRSGSDDGKALALDAARDAVAACDHGAYGLPDDYCDYIERADALAAIDALLPTRVISRADIREISVNTDGSGTGAVMGSRDELREPRDAPHDDPCDGCPR